MCLRCEVLSWRVDFLLSQIALANEDAPHIVTALEDDLSVQHVLLLESQDSCKEV